MNVTNSTAGNFVPPSPYNEEYWIISEAILILVTFIDLYFFKSIICYLWKLRKKKNREQVRFLLGLSLVAVIMALGRFTANQTVAFLGWQTDDFCFTSFAVSVVFYSASISPVYIFLWKRQHLFYSNKQMQALNNKKIVVLSYTCLSLLVVGWIVLSVVYLLPEVTGWEYAATQEGCRDKNDEQDFEILPILVNLVGGAGQLSLLCLLLLPLLKVRTQNKRMSVKTQKKSQTSVKVPNNSIKETAAHVHEDKAEKSEFNFAVNPGYLGAEDGFQSDGDLGKCSSPKPNSAFLSPKKTLVSQLRDEGTRTHRNSNASTISNTRKQRTLNRNEAKPKRSRTEKRRERRMKKLIEKVFFLALGCVGTDIVATVLQLLLVQPEFVYLVIYDVNLIINIFCIILSFEKWKDILFSWRKGCKKEKTRTTSVTSQMSLQALAPKKKPYSPRRKRVTSSLSSAPSSRPATPDNKNQSEPQTMTSYSVTSEM